MFFKYVSRIPSRFMHYIWFLCLFSHFKSRRVPPWVCVYICIDIYNICICICIYFCIYMYETLLFKLFPILICLITSSWCHLPSFSMPCFPSILEVKSWSLRFRLDILERIRPGDSEGFVKHLIRGT